MKKEKKQTYTYTTEPSIKEKAAKRAQKEGLTLSERIDLFLWAYSNTKPDDYETVGEELMARRNRQIPSKTNQ